MKLVTFTFKVNNNVFMRAQVKKDQQLLQWRAV